MITYESPLGGLNPADDGLLTEYCDVGSWNGDGEYLSGITIESAHEPSSVLWKLGRTLHRWPYPRPQRPFGRSCLILLCFVLRRGYIAVVEEWSEIVVQQRREGQGTAFSGWRIDHLGSKRILTSLSSKSHGKVGVNAITNWDRIDSLGTSVGEWRPCSIDSMVSPRSGRGLESEVTSTGRHSKALMSCSRSLVDRDSCSRGRASS